jgi:partner of Y14 and mago protein
MAEPSNAGIVQVGEERVIPGSQRADGSFRKERKVRPGFVPLEDVKRYTIPQNKSANPGSGKPGIPGGKKKEVVKPVKKDLPAPSVPLADQPTEKKVKVLNKKIRQITDLEQKLIKGETLNEEQQEKVKKGKSLRDEMAKLSL